MAPKSKYQQLSSQDGGNSIIPASFNDRYDDDGKWISTEIPATVVPSDGGESSSLWKQKVLFGSFLSLVIVSVLCSYQKSGMDNVNCPIPSWTEHPKCSHLQHRPIPSNEWWDNVRNAYVTAVGGEEKSSIGPWSISGGRVVSEGGNLSDAQQETTPRATTIPSMFGWHVPTEVHASPLHGRGVFAAEKIPKGTKVWDNRFMARCPDECCTRRFFALLSNDDICEMLLWDYPTNQFSGDPTKYEYVVDLDESSLINDATKLEDVNVELEFDYSKHNVNTPGAFALYAKHDIQQGDELIMDYGELEISFHPSLWYYHKLRFFAMGYEPLYRIF